ncbi:MAG: hypothetical protein EA427_01145 [Spirochaetaceae bacterium]|nr:MAG: hypothetical protein EA427_01145 [Spirochaetaceae bacterium]
MGESMKTIRQRKGTACFPALLFLATILAGFAAWVVTGPHLAPYDIPDPLADPGALLRGRVTAAVDRSVEEEHPFREPALALVTALRLAFFREGSGPVVVGRDYRLYTREEFEYHRDDEATLARRLAWVQAAAEMFREDGVPLIIVLVPSKARVASLENHWRRESALRFLGEEAFALVDPLPELIDREDSFLRTDTHWSWSGALATARLVARTYKERYDTPLPGGARFVLEEPGTREHRGDLMRFLPLGRWERLFPLKPDVITLPGVREEAAPGAGLFDVPAIPVALVGTSFSVGDAWNFAGALQYSLQADVLALAEEGLGPFEPMQRYLTSETYREIEPSLVVWEIPERYLTLPETALPDLPQR